MGSEPEGDLEWVGGLRDLGQIKGRYHTRGSNIQQAVLGSCRKGKLFIGRELRGLGDRGCHPEGEEGKELRGRGQSKRGLVSKGCHLAATWGVSGPESSEGPGQRGVFMAGGLSCQLPIDVG